MAFPDRLMVRYLDPVAVRRLVAPAGDAALVRVRALLAGVYRAETLDFEAVDDVTVHDTSFQVPVAAGRTSRGTWEKITPSPERTMLTLDAPAGAPSDWIDLVLQTTVAVRVSERGPVLESVASEPVPAAGAAEHSREYHLRYAEPPAYLPDDPAVRRTYPLRVCALFFGTAELVPALRRVIAARREVDAAGAFHETHEGGAVTSAAAWIAVFDVASLPDPAPAPGPSRDDVTRLLAAEGIVAAFEAA